MVNTPWQKGKGEEKEEGENIGSIGTYHRTRLPKAPSNLVLNRHGASTGQPLPVFHHPLSEDFFPSKLALLKLLTLVLLLHFQIKSLSAVMSLPPQGPKKADVSLFAYGIRVLSSINNEKLMT